MIKEQMVDQELTGKTEVHEEKTCPSATVSGPVNAATLSIFINADSMLSSFVIFPYIFSGPAQEFHLSSCTCEFVWP
jgi:hypothetical protein